LRQLFVERLDGGFLLFQDFLDEFLPVGFERLLLGKEFLDRIIWHDAIMPEIFLRPQPARGPRRSEVIMYVPENQKPGRVKLAPAIGVTTCGGMYAPLGGNFCLT